MKLGPKDRGTFMDNFVMLGPIIGQEGVFGVRFWLTLSTIGPPFWTPFWLTVSTMPECEPQSLDTSWNGSPFCFFFVTEANQHDDRLICPKRLYIRMNKIITVNPKP